MRADIDGAAWGIEAARAVQGGAPDCENKQVRGSSAGGFTAPTASMWTHALSRGMLMEEQCSTGGIYTTRAMP